VIRVALLAASALAAAGCSGAVPQPARVGWSDLPGGGEVRVLLPPGYPDGAPYPVLYFLHDYFGTRGVLWRKGVANELEERMRDGRLQPLVVVCPEGDHGYWSDAHGGGASYETFVTGPLIDWVEARFRVRRDRAGRAVSGISMGGLGAVKAALRRPDLYSSASSLSGALIPLDRESVLGYSWIARRQLFRVFGADPVDNSLLENDPVNLLRSAQVRDLELLLRAGDEHEYRLDEAARKFVELARTRGIEAEFVVEPGKHDWSYWRRSLPGVVEWHARRFEEARR